MSPDQQKALNMANDKRARITELRHRIASNRAALDEVLLDPPEALERMAIADVVRLAYSQRSGAAMERLGRLALRDGVNLMMPLGRASLRSREWVAEHAAWRWASCEAPRRGIVVEDRAA